MASPMIIGDAVDGCAPAFRSEGECLDFGLRLDGGETRWLPGMEILPFSGRLAVVRDVASGRYGAIDRRGEMVFPARYERIAGFAGDLGFVTADGTTSLVDVGGTELKRFAERIVGDEFCDSLAVVSDAGAAGRYGLVDASGEFVLPLEQRGPGWVEPHHAGDRRFGDGLIRVMVDSRVAYVDRTSQTMIPPEFEAGTRFNEGLAAVRQRGSWGFIDRRGKTVLPFEWDDAQAFSGGLAPVLREGVWGVIDRRGRIVVPCEFRELGSFRAGHACARTEFGSGLIDRSGRFIVPALYDEITHFHDGIARVTLQGVRGVIDRSLTVLWDDRIV